MNTRPILAAALLLALGAPAAHARDRWTKAEADAWQGRTPWLVGCNYIPSTAINQLEMWQADTFDPKTIDRELGWAESLGFTSVRVFLHDIPWRDDHEGFLKRIDEFLAIAEKHHIGVMFVLFDAVWDPNPKAGPQRAPKPGLHNSGWVQGPGAAILGDPARHDELKGYVQGIVGHFKGDPRVHAWDLFNEPDNPNRSSYGDQELKDKEEKAVMLLEKAFAWARAMNPTQPLTSGVWVGDWADETALRPIERLQLEQSDVISFHTYDPLPDVQKRVASLRRYGRPLICTEYMARPAGSKFDPMLRYFKEEHVGAYSWGFVAGKSQTIYPWDSWQKPYDKEPDPWFHDIFRTDGTPYRPAEVEYIRRTTGKPAP
jgi:hypothetical protein